MKKYLLKAIAIVAAMGFCSTNAMAADPDLENDYTLVKSFAAGLTMPVLLCWITVQVLVLQPTTLTQL